MLRLAFRNLWRNGRRTAITVAAIGFGLSMILATIAMQRGTYGDLVRTGVRSLAGHVVVSAEGWNDTREGDQVLGRASDAVARVRAALPEATVAPRLSLGGLLVSAHGSVGAMVTGADGVAEVGLQDVDDRIVEGSWLDGKGRGVVLGAGLADALGVGLGDKVVYMGQHGGAKEVGSRLFRVLGVFRTGVPEIDGFTAWVDLAAAQEAFGRPDIVHQVTVHLTDPEDTERAREAVAAALADLADVEVLGWPTVLRELVAVIEVDKSTNDLLLGVLGLIVVMGALNTVLMSVLERTREFGVLLAIGLRPRRLAGVVLFEGFLLGVLGAALGAVGGGLLGGWLVVYGLDYRDFVGESYATAGVVLSGVMKGGVDPGRSLGAIGLAVLATTLAAAWPAFVVSRLTPVDALRAH
jgi:ABC-type lipoprotein release transport system permease subunit